MKSIHSITRRDFQSAMAIAGSALELLDAVAAPGQTTVGKRYPIIGFSKAFQQLNFEETAQFVAEVGWDGIECPVRKGGQVLPERVEEDLPKIVQALKKRGREVAIITTDIRRATDSLAEKVLRTASKLGIRLYRLTGLRYRKDQSIPAQIAERHAELRDLAALNKELGMCAGFQNHSGSDNIGAPVWDIYEIIKDLDRQHIVIFFDIGHATVEGGYAWPLHARLLEPFFQAVYIKDFAWQKGAKGWDARWCPLGEGMINRSFLAWLKQTAFSGPISQHHEYPVGTGQQTLRLMRKDLETLQRWLTEAE